MGIIGSRIVQLKSVDSTNNYVAKAIEEGKYQDGTVILAENQTEGRGQRGSIWQSEVGANLTFSFGLDIDFLPLHLHFLLSKSVSLGLSDYLKSVFGPVVWIKWPNDLLVNGAKIAGILIEIKAGAKRNAIIGMGINVNQINFPETFKATSMAKELGVGLSIQEVFHSLIGYIELRLGQLVQGQYELLDAGYKAHLYGSSFWVNFQTGERRFQGTVAGVDHEGVLTVRSRQGAAYSFRAKEVKIAY